MRSAKNASDVRSLTDVELADVSGGAIPLAVGIAAAVGGLAMIGIGWSRLPVGTTAQDAAAALGMGHLL
ncbi:MAG: class IIb bacteriocin, lactobin A/cerein 7B family [Alphaproteobacteria bacterium]|nr:class IIb bacteriocin, lactobin A/cerein 7B family [Alphaproteobacteria bacterium]